MDLRPFLDRIQTPLWETTEQLFFSQEVTEEMVNEALGETGNNDPWGLMGNVHWPPTSGP